MAARTWLLMVVVALAVPLPAWADPASDQFAVGAGHFGQRRWQLAIDEFRAFAAEFPQHARADEARFFVGESLVQLRDFSEAAHEFTELVAREPREPWRRKAWFRAGEAYLFAGDLEQARDKLVEFLGRYPNDALSAYALPYLGDIAIEQDKAAEAEKYYHQALARWPDGPLADDCRFGRAQSLDKQMQQVAARKLYREVADDRTSAWADDALVRLARSYFDEDDYAAATAACEELAERFADSPWRDRAELLRGQSCYGLGQYERAIETLQKLVDRKDTGAEARLWLGLSLRGAGRTDDAIRTLTEASQRDDAGELAGRMRLHAAEAMFEAGRHETARNAFRDISTALDREPDADKQLAVDARLGVMRASLAMGDHQELERTYEALRALDAGAAQAATARLLHWRSQLAQGRAAEIVGTLAVLVERETTDDEPTANALEHRYLLALAYDQLDRPADVLRIIDTLLAAGAPEQRSGALRLQAGALIATGQHAAAVGPLKTLIAMTGVAEDVAEARSQLSLCLAKSKRFDAARAAFLELSESEPSGDVVPRCAAALAAVAVEHGDHDWARELYSALTRDNVPNELAMQGRLGLASLDYQQGRLAEAAEQLEHLLAASPPSALAGEASRNRARILEHQQKWHEALEVYRGLLQSGATGPALASALAGAARIHVRLDQPGEAAPLYERLLAEFPADKARVDWLYDAAWAHAAVGSDDAAMRLFAELREKHRESRYWADAVYRLAEHALKHRQHAEAEKLLDELLDAQSEPQIRSYARYLRAQVAMAREQWAEASRWFERLLAEDADGALAPLARYWIAEATYRQGDYEAAAERFALLEKQYAGDEPWHVMLPLRRAQSLLQLKQWREAEQLAAEVARKFSNSDQLYEADYVLGRALAAQARFDEAREAYRRVIRSPQGAKTETAAMAQWMTGESYFHQKNYEAAVREYLRVEILYDFPSWQACGLLQAGKCHEALGEWAQAVELYARLLKSYSDTSFSAEATRRLEAARGRLASRR